MSSRLMRIAALVGLAVLLTFTIAAAQQRARDEPVGAGTGPQAQGIAVFNPVEGRIRVLSSRPDGARVEKGEVVCELDPADIQDQLASQEVAVQGVRAGVQGARLAREVAVMELNEYKEGGYAQEINAIQGEIKLAESNLVRAEDNLEWGRRMFDKGYSSMAEKVAKELAFKKAQYALEQAQARKQALVERSREKTTRALMGAIETAREGELGKQATLRREESALKKLHDQIGQCKVAAPVAGRVRYDATIGPGAVVRDGQVLFRIVPDGPAGAAK